MRRTIYLIFLFCSLFLQTEAQNEPSSLSFDLDSLKSSRTKIDRLKQLFESQNNSLDTSLEIELWQRLCDLFQEEETYQDGLKYANELIEKNRSKNSKEYKRSQYFLSLMFKKFKDNKAQFTQLKKIIAENNVDIYTCHAYTDIASNLARNGDFDKGIEYLNIALSNNNLSSNLEHELRIRMKMIYLLSVKFQNDFDNNANNEDLQNIDLHFARIADKFDESGIELTLLAVLYNNLANLYDSQSDHELALEMYINAGDYFKNAQDTFRFLEATTNISITYSLLNLNEKALNSMNLVINESKDKEQRATALANMGYYLKSDDPREKLTFYNRALSIILEEKEAFSDEIILPGLAQIKKSNEIPTILIYLNDLTEAYILSYEFSQDKTYLIKAQETISLVDELTSLMRYNSLSENSKLHWIEEGSRIYMQGVSVSYELQDISKAFYFMEKNKSLLLQENIKTFQSRLKQNLPAKLLEREYELFYKVADWNKNVLREPDNEFFRETFFQVKQEYDLLMDSLNTNHPEFVKSKKEIEISNLNQVDKLFTSEKECLVEYIMSNEEAYGIFITNTERIFFNIPNVDTLQKDIARLKKYMSKKIMNKETQQEYQRIAHSVFESLFPIKDILEKIKDKKLSIICDHSLMNLPFEALTYSLDKSLASSFLINHTEITYLQSVSTFDQIDKKKNNPSKKLLVLSPNEFLASSLPNLSESAEEMNDLLVYKDIDVLKGAKATKSNFLKNLKNFEIIHLNTHAGIDSSGVPWIAFYDEIINGIELIGKENQAELVILDACKSNDGRLVQGEGILNLSRSFFYNGTKSVLASIWNVNERSGNEIISSFYNHLEMGKTKSKALQIAKRNYINTHQYSEILPYYWAGFTLMGSTDSIDLPRSNRHNIFLAIVLVFLAGLCCVILPYKFKKN